VNGGTPTPNRSEAKAGRMVTLRSGSIPRGRTHAGRAIPWTLVFTLLLAGCHNNGMSDLRQFVEEAKQKKGRVAPLPQFKPVETFTYEDSGLRDPFGTAGPLNARLAQDKGAGPMPDTHRRKEILESYPLDALHMLGTLEFKDTKWGLIQAPDGIVYRIKPGNHIGQNYGKVEMIHDNKITLVEIVPDGLGGWLERNAYLAINEQ
jgi:type IV pilus assembly protein PilP